MATMKARISMASSQSVQRGRIGSEHGERSRAEQDENQIEHGLSLRCEGLRCALKPSEIHSHWQSRE
jgi:hypothetical protein